MKLAEQFLGLEIILENYCWFYFMRPSDPEDLGAMRPLRP